MFARWTWNHGGATSVFSTNVAEQVGIWGKNHNRWKTSAPRKGDIVVRAYGSLDGGTGGHVGVIEYVSNGVIHSIDGNWDNAVTRAHLLGGDRDDLRQPGSQGLRGTARSLDDLTRS